MSATSLRFSQQIVDCDASRAESIALWLLRSAFVYGPPEAARRAEQHLGGVAARRLEKVPDHLMVFVNQFPPGEIPLCHPQERLISDAEFDLVTVLAKFQHHDDAIMLIDRLGWSGVSDLGKMTTALHRYAEVLNDCDLTLAAPSGRPIRSSGEPVLLRELDPRECLLVVAIRQWVGCYKEGIEGLTSLLNVFWEQHLEAAGPPLHSLLIQTATTCTRYLQVNCETCTKLAPDEARVVYSVSAAQRNDERSVQSLLGSWLPPSAVRVTKASITAIANVFLNSKFRLPLRSWRFPELCGDSTWSDDLVRPDNMTLH